MELVLVQSFKTKVLKNISNTDFKWHRCTWSESAVREMLLMLHVPEADNMLIKLQQGSHNGAMPHAPIFYIERELLMKISSLIICNIKLMAE